MTLWSRLRQFRNRLAPGALILLYHRVAEVDSDPWSLCVSPKHFAEQLEVLQHSGQVVPLQQFTQTLQQRKHPQRQFVITFDDGYADNLHYAKPLLARYDSPATIFVASGHVGQTREFWWDELERLLLQPGTLPATLSLCISGKSYTWELGEFDRYYPEDYERHRSWRALSQGEPTSRQSLYCSLYFLLRPLPEDERQQALDELLSWAGIELVNRHSHRTMSAAELSALEQDGLIEIGAHTVNHPFLSALSAPMQQAEIQQSKAELEEVLGHSVTSFAYPYGDYTADAIATVRESGFSCACSTIASSIRNKADRFLLPRVGVENWDGDKFAQRLEDWLIYI